MEHVFLEINGIDSSFISIASYMVKIHIQQWRVAVHNPVQVVMIPLYSPTQSFLLIGSLNYFKICRDYSHVASVAMGRKVFE